MMLLPLFLIPILWGLDGFSTIYFMSKYQQKFKDDHWINIEANPIVRFFWRKYGLYKGMIISMICVMPIIIGVSIMASFDRFILGVAIGMYFLTFMEHFHAIKFVVRKIDKRQ